MKKQPQWIFFDLDDTLIPSSQAYEHAYKKLNLGKDKLFKDAKEYVKKTLPHDHTSSHNRFLYFKKYLSLKKNLSPKDLLKLNSQYEKYLTEYIKRNTSKNLIKNLSALSKRYHLAVVTNENCRTQILKLNCFDPKGKLFKCIVTSEDVGFEKPHSRIFKEVLDLCQTNPNQVVFVGDSIKNDYEPATKLGMKALLLTEFRDESVNYNKKVRKINSLEELITLSKE